MAAMADPSAYQESYFVSYPRKKIRIIAKIQDFVGRQLQPSDGCPSSCISFEDDAVEESKEDICICLSDRETGKSERFKLDRCYGKDVELESVFSKEMGPLISGIFRGFDSTVFFHGGKTSGKNAMIQGLVPLSMAEILSRSDRMAYLVRLSCYEVRCEPHGDRCYDFLGFKDREVSVWEDKDGKIQLKGLAQVPIKSISDFSRVLSDLMGSDKTSQKGLLEAPRKSHRGIMVWVSAKSEQESTAKVVGKMNFIDLAGYEDVKQKVENSSHKIESTRTNKSLCDLLRVVHGLNMNGNGIAWRESKLARILRDSLGRKSQSLLVACLNASSYQECTCTLSLVSRPYQSIMGYRKDTPRPKQNTTSRLKKELLTSTSCKLQSPFGSVTKNRNVERSPLTFSTLFKSRTPIGSSKVPNSSRFNSRRKVLDAVSATTETRKEFLVLASTLNPKEETVLSSVLPILEEPSAVEDNCPQDDHDAAHSFQIASTAQAMEIASAVELISISEDSNVNKENMSLSIKFDENSPPISARLKAIKENLESLCSPLPFGTITPCKDNLIVDSSKAPLEPITPTITSDAFMNTGTPLDKFNAMSAGLKRSLVQEYVALLNTASKDELMKMKGIGEKRAEYILQLRQDSPEPLKELSDLKRIGLSQKQINLMLSKVAGGMFN